MQTCKKSPNLCHYPGCENTVKGNYYYCYQHKNEKFYSVCKYHGKQIFIGNVCEKCLELREPMYTIKRCKNNFYINNKLININSDEWAWAKDYIILFSDHKRTNFNRGMKRINSSAGIYGIFYKKSKKCLYIGQSTNISRRVGQHKKKIREAAKDKKRRKLKSGELNYAYYFLSKAGIENLEFKRIISFPESYMKEIGKDRKFLILTIAEQWAFDTFHPKTNVVAARITNYK